MNMEKVKDVAEDLQQLTADELVAVIGCLLLTCGSATTTSIVYAFSNALTIPDEARMKATPHLYLQECGEHKIRVLRVLREHLKLPLKEVKALAGAAPCLIKAELTPTQREILYRELVAVGAIVKAC
jgi:ribosomal protein L7/L12